MQSIELLSWVKKKIEHWRKVGRIIDGNKCCRDTEANIL